MAVTTRAPGDVVTGSGTILSGTGAAAGAGGIETELPSPGIPLSTWKLATAISHLTLIVPAGAFFFLRGTKAGIFNSKSPDSGLLTPGTIFHLSRMVWPSIKWKRLINGTSVQ